MVRGKGRALPATLACAALLSACAAPDARRAELNALSRYYALPQSAPATFTTTFEAHCLDLLATPDAIGPALEEVDYVPRFARPRAGVQTWVVDDSRPAVTLIRRDGRLLCGVAAISRTGQTAAVQRLIARRFPAAAPATPPRRAEAAWTAEPGLMLYAMRHNDDPSRGATYQLIAARLEGAPS